MSEDDRLAELEVRADAAELALGLLLRIMAPSYSAALDTTEEVLLAWLAAQPEPDDAERARGLRVVMRTVERLGARDAPIEEQLPA